MGKHTLLHKIRLLYPLPYRWVLSPLETLSSATNIKESQSNKDKLFACQTVSNLGMETDLKPAISLSLNKYDSKVILDPLLKYRDVFNAGLGDADVITHKIDMGDTTIPKVNTLCLKSGS